MASLLSGVTVGIAGCNGESSDSGGADDPGSSSRDTNHSIPDYVVDEDAQQSPVVVDVIIHSGSDDLNPGEQFPIDVAIANLGGADITDMETPAGFVHEKGGYAGGRDTIELTDVPSGEWTSNRIELAVETVGMWSLAVPETEMHPQVEPKITVSTSQIGIGDSASILDGVSVELLESRIQPTAFSNQPSDAYDEPGKRLFYARNAVWAINRFEVTVDRDDPIALGESDPDSDLSPYHRVFPDEANPIAEPLYNSINDLSKVQIQGEPLTTDSVLKPGTTEMWSIAEIQEDETENVEVGLSVYELDRIRTNQVNNPDVVFDTFETPLKIPEFELVDSSLDTSNLILEATVRNVGEVAGTFRGTVEWEVTGGRAGYSDSIIAEIPAGEKVTKQLKLPDTAVVDFMPFGETFYLNL